jgi:hypothetical protein
VIALDGNTDDCPDVIVTSYGSHGVTQPHYHNIMQTPDLSGTGLTEDPDDRPNIMDPDDYPNLVDLWFELMDAGYTEDEAFEMIELTIIHDKATHQDTIN